eukprot:1159586-Pelagomonas_calceolata.AAC.13
MGPENRQNACQNGALRKLPPGLPDQQPWMGTSSGANSEGSGGQGQLSRNSLPIPQFWQGKWSVRITEQPVCHLEPQQTSSHLTDSRVPPQTLTPFTARQEPLPGHLNP